MSSGLLYFASLAILVSVSTASANEVCKSALREYGMASMPAAEQDARAHVLKACQGDHGSDNAMIQKLLKKCDLYFKGNQQEWRDKCRVDAYRYISWFEYP